MRQRTVVLIVLLLAACGASAQRKALHATYIGVKAAEVNFLAWDRRHQEDIVTHANNLSEGYAQLAEYWQARGPVLEAFVAAYKLLYVALADPTSDRIDDAIKAAAALYELIDVLKHPRPPLETRRDGLWRIARRQVVQPAMVLEVPQSIRHVGWGQWGTAP